MNWPSNDTSNRTIKILQKTNKPIGKFLRRKKITKYSKNYQKPKLLKKFKNMFKISFCSRFILALVEFRGLIQPARIFFDLSKINKNISDTKSF